MALHTRYQGAIVRDHQILLISHREHNSGRTYWLLPGGSIESGETEEDCVIREMKEETGLDVRVERLLVTAEDRGSGAYQWFKSYLCTPLSGEPAPGYEPEPEAATVYSIDAVAWFDLREPGTWGLTVQNDPWTYPQLLKVREALGYG